MSRGSNKRDYRDTLNRRDFIRNMGLGTAALIMPQSVISGKQIASKPNIVLILADDLGYADLGCYGQKRIRTPNIDEMAAEGMRFTQAYAGACVCAPSRCSLLTGLHLGHARIRNNCGGRVPLEPEDLIVAKVLKQTGYTTATIGKWAVGDPGTSGVPHKQGFDYAFGYYKQSRAFNYYPEFVWRNDEKVVLEGNIGYDMKAMFNFDSTPFSETNIAKAEFNNRYTSDGRYIPAGVKDPDKAVYITDLFTAEALEFIRKNKDNPFFLYLPYTLPHGPLVDPQLEPYTNNDDWPSLKHKLWATMITRLDREVGKIMAQLKESGIDDNTIVFFTSDNGYSCTGYFGVPSQENEDDPFFENRGPFRGAKFGLYEGGIRIPAIVRWPGKIKPGSVNDHVWAFWDFLPTAAQLANVKPPNNTEGISIVPALLGEKQKQHEYLYWEHQLTQAVRMGKYKAYRGHPDKPTQLYDLETDIGETKDLAAKHPEIIKKIEEIFINARVDSSVFPNPRKSN